MPSGNTYEDFDLSIGVYIVSTNYGRYVEDAIVSVLTQSRPVDSIVLVDNGSCDSTKNIFEKYRKLPAVTIVSFEERLPLTAVANYAFSQIECDYLMRVDGDDYLDEQAVLVLGNALDSGPNIGCVSPNYYLISEDGDRLFLNKSPAISDGVGSSNSPPHGACTLIRKDAFSRYDETASGQDGLNLWLAIKNNWQVIHVATPLFYYRQHGKSLSRNGGLIDRSRRIHKHNAIIRTGGCVDFCSVILARRYFDFAEDLGLRVFQDSISVIEILVQKLIEAGTSKIVIGSDNIEPYKTIFERRKLDVQLLFFEREFHDTLPTCEPVYSLLEASRILNLGREDCALITYPQAANLDLDIFKEVITTLKSFDGDSVMYGSLVRSQLFRQTRNGLLNVNNFRTSSVFSDTHSVYRDEALCYAVNSRTLADGTLFGPKHFCLQVPDGVSPLCDESWV